MTDQPPGQPYGDQPLPPEAYTPWLTRVVAWLIDQLPVYLVIGIGSWIWLASAQGTVCVTDSSEYELGEFCKEGFIGPTVLGWAALAMATVFSLGFALWNLGFRQGNTGSSVGKTIMKFKVIGEKTGQPIGFGLSVIRQFAHFVDQIVCYIGYLLPLWDTKRQTLADKIMSTVCVQL
ncbi:RDD family protein [Mycobacterium sp. DL592]|uniref:RDD family protein n=1 Tax=Mycobacterium sp. DL592 TaxID=2675524 RepID=UPI001421F211|nr:RDD family protein [Mycobacterium sp. DL592]